MRRHLAAYSLLEMCIVLAVLGIMLMAGIMGLSGARTRGAARRCRGNLQALSHAVSAYAQEYRLAPGAVVHFTNIYPRFWPHASPGRCPASGVEYPRVYTNGVPVACPSAATYPDHCWSPLSTEF